jgi:hypothetical protein
MTSLLAIDPGKRHCGWAYFQDGQLLGCGVIEGKDPLAVAQNLVEFTDIPLQVDTLVIENQQVYGGRIKTDPNDLLPLAQCVGAIRALVPCEKFLNPTPVTWKGTVPKAIFTERIEAGLSESERQLVDSAKLTKKYRVDCLDSIGLAKWALAR